MKSTSKSTQTRVGCPSAVVVLNASVAPFAGDAGGDGVPGGGDRAGLAAVRRVAPERPLHRGLGADLEFAGALRENVGNFELGGAEGPLRASGGGVGRILDRHADAAKARVTEVVAELARPVEVGRGERVRRLPDVGRRGDAGASELGD